MDALLVLPLLFLVFYFPATWALNLFCVSKNNWEAGWQLFFSRYDPVHSGMCVMLDEAGRVVASNNYLFSFEGMIGIVFGAVFVFVLIGVILSSI